MSLLEAKKIEKFYGAHRALHDIDIVVGEQEIIGLIGNNGAGKTTFCNILSGEDTDFYGELQKPSRTIISYFRQINKDTLANEKTTVFEYVLASQQHVLDIEQRYHDALRDMQKDSSEEMIEKFGEIQEEYMATEAYNLIERIEETLQGLGIAEHGDGTRNISWTSELKDLSGGERKIVELATILLNKKANLLILDEPTNHLDIEGREWLEKFIRDFKGSVVIVSHDRYLLNRLAQTIWEVDKGTVIKYKGNYELFEKLKHDNTDALIHLYDMQQKELGRLEEALKDLKYRVSIGGSPPIVAQYNAMKTRIERYKETMIDHPLKGKTTLTFALTKPPEFGHMAVKIEDFSFSYTSGRKIFEHANANVVNGERIALLGANGSGKSTLMKILLTKYCQDRNITPNAYGITKFVDEYGAGIKSTRAIVIGPGIKLAYYSQNHGQLNDAKTIRETLRDIGIGAENEFQSIIRRFQFDKDTVDNKYIGDLSGGEKSKIQFMLVMLTKANLLLLDEPINHLDIESMKVVEKVLAEYTGTLMVISHDRYFLNRVITKVLYVNNHSLKEYLGTYDEFLEKTRK